MTAAAVSAMLLGAIIPFATFAAPCAASAFLLCFCLEFGGGAALALYAAVSVLSALMIPDKELAAFFICVVGYYPVLKLALERLRARVLASVLKLAAFNASVTAMYLVLSGVVGLPSVKAEFESYSAGFAILLLALANASFLLYDLALSRAALFYNKKFRPRAGR
jgi:hypothetical protein